MDFSNHIRVTKMTEKTINHHSNTGLVWYSDPAVAVILYVEGRSILFVSFIVMGRTLLATLLELGRVSVPPEK